MDAARFDGLARSLFAASTRRATLGLGAAGVLGALGFDDTDAKRKGKKNKKKCKKCGPCAKCKKGKCKPKAAGTPCGEGKQCFANGKCLACDVCTDGCQHETLQQAIEAASQVATIQLCPGTYPTNATFVGKKLTVIGAGSGPGGTTLDGGGAGTVVQVLEGATVTLRALRVSGGNADVGGGIVSFNATLTLDACVVSENEADIAGGGIYNFGFTLTLIDSNVSENAADDGGGIANGRTLIVTDSTVRENDADGAGGGIYNFDAGTVTLTGSDISENIAATGGGIYNSGGTVTLINSDVTGNDVSLTGGGILQSGATVTLDAPSRVTGNTAANGGGIYNMVGTVTLASAANVSGNTPNDCAGSGPVTQCEVED